ncbi:DinB family protein [Muricauda sp. 334s03]|uniref:DinB family protein n=1 Tax=Flagellimonas yonaguniensis TaxID=3031325 RepID=A0ABT5Y470_9FLAO|nr:DinB family protein [[Muricauda] yonaguniensis]MDF0718248.1 DinB family protein [[Muricauda] yonaguniensis]
MNRRLLLSLIGLGPLALISSKIPNPDNALILNMIKRWRQSKAYTLAVLEAMPAEQLEYAPSDVQMSFAQHLMHLGLVNNFYFGILTDVKTYATVQDLLQADFLIPRPDPINLFQPDSLQERDSLHNQELVQKYVSETFDYVLSCLETMNDSMLTQGKEKEKPGFLAAHGNLDLILRGDSHTAHHRGQAVGYLRLNGIRPPGYTKYHEF